MHDDLHVKLREEVHIAKVYIDQEAVYCNMMTYRKGMVIPPIPIIVVEIPGLLKEWSREVKWHGKTMVKDDMDIGTCLVDPEDVRVAPTIVITTAYHLLQYEGYPANIIDMIKYGVINNKNVPDLKIAMTYTLYCIACYEHVETQAEPVNESGNTWAVRGFCSRGHKLYKRVRNPGLDAPKETLDYLRGYFDREKELVSNIPLREIVPQKGERPTKWSNS